MKETIHVLSAIEATRMRKPYIIAACRCGKHKSKKDYSRKDKSWKRELYDW